MTREEKQGELYDKMVGEQERNKDWILAKPTDKILVYAYSFSMREDIFEN